MKPHLSCKSFLMVLVSIVVLGQGAGGESIIHESATLGITGQLSGWILSKNELIGSRFHIDQYVEVTQIGGHLSGTGEFFGAIISLNSFGSRPQGSPFTASEVVASVVFSRPSYRSIDYRTALSVVLEPGDYALVLGSGYLGASESYGAMSYLLQENLPGASYFFWDGSAWHNTNPNPPPRFVVEGITDVTISGHIRTSDSTAIEVVLVSADNGGGSGVTDANGYYELTVPYNWSGTVEPDKTGWFFEPENRTYSNVVTEESEQDYTAIRGVVISGHAADAHGIFVEGVTVSGNNGGGSDTTDSNGYYEITVPYEWSGIVTPAKTGWIFEPVTRPYSNVTADQTNQDYVAFQPKISGYIQGYEAEGVTISADGGGGSDITGPDGFYEISVPYGWSGTVTPGKTGWEFEPESRTYSNVTADQTNQDYQIFQAKISGYVTFRNGGSGMGQVEVLAENIGVLAITNFSGYYELVVPYNWSGTVILTCPWEPWGFIPPSRSYSNVTGHTTEQNYQGFQPLIRGAVHNGLTYMGDVTFTADGIGTYYSDVGPYRFTVPYGWSGTITPSRPGYGFIPSSRTYTNVIQDLPNEDYGFFRPVITGHIYDTDGAAIGGVLVEANNNGGSDTTDINGYYRIIVPYEWSGTVTVSKEGWHFDPNQSVYDNVVASVNEENYIGYQPKISGCIQKGDGTGLEGVSVTLNNSSGSAVTDSEGCYAVSVPYDWSGLILVSKNGWGFDPNQRAYQDVISDQNEQNYTAFQLMISGCVTDQEGAGAEGVTMSANNGGGLDTTDLNGYYEITVPYDWSGTVTPGKTDWGFDPVERTYSNIVVDQTNQDYQIFQPEISGYVTDTDGIGIDGIVVSADNGGGSDASEPNGHYEITVPYNWSGTVTPNAPPDWGFIPVNYSYSNITAEQTNQDFRIFQPTISGYIKDAGGIAIEGITVSADNGAGSDITDSYGYYEIVVVYGWSGTVVPTKTGLGLVPFRQIYNNVISDQINQDYLAHVPQTIVVRADGTGDYPTIQAAIDAALNGDTIIVEDGIYTGSGNRDIDFKGKTVTVRSIEPGNPAIVAATIVDPDKACPGFYFHSGEGSDSVVDGLTITEGYSGIGGGITCRDSSPTIRNCTIRDCFAVSHGGGIGLEDSNATIINCIVTDNSTTEMGGGIACLYSGSPSIINCLITGNSASWTGGGIASSGCNAAISNCTLVGNQAHNRYNNTGWGGALSIVGIANISNCILWNNYANDGPEIAVLRINQPSTATVFCCDVQGGEAGIYLDGSCTLNWDNAGNMDTDPCFAQPGYWIITHISGPQPPPPLPPPDYTVYLWVNGDYHLRSRAGRWKSSIYLRLNPTVDRFINLLDFAAFSSSWQQEGGSIPADLDRSGIVDSFDLKLVLDNYLSSYPLGQWVTDEVTSPCIDAGNPHSDWTEELWPHGRRINMGAYGGRPEASMSLSDAGNIADLVIDDYGCICYIDMKQLTDQWLYEELPLAGDLDRNGIVNFTDFAIFTNNMALQPSLPGIQASNPYPPDGAGISILDADLSWSAGPYPVSHDVYFGTSNPPPFIGNQTAMTFDPGIMIPDTTYYWRIDEVSDYCTIEGRMWSFTIMTGPPPPPL